MFQWLVSSYILLLVTWACAHTLAFQTNVTNNSKPSFLDLSCPLHSWIHVTKMTYDRPGSCGAYPLPGCTTSIVALTKIVNKECIGRAKCQKNVQLPQIKWSSFQLNVDYDCIEDNRLNICDTTNEIKLMRDSFYLHSPGYRQSRGVPGNCTCNITGDGIKVTALEVNLSYRNSHFEVRGDNRVGLSSLVDQYDVDVLHNSRRGQVVYFNGGVKDQNAWLEVSHSSIATVSCTGPPPQQSTSQILLPPNPAVKSRPPVGKTKVSPRPTDQSRNPDLYSTSFTPLTTYPQNINIDDYLDDEEGDIKPWVVVAVVGGVVGMCTVVVVVVVVLIKRRKRRLFSRSVPEVPKSNRSLPEVPNMAGTGPLPPAVPQRQDAGGYANPYLELTNTNNVYTELATQYPQGEEHRYSVIKKDQSDLYLTPQPAYTDAMS